MPIAYRIRLFLILIIVEICSPTTISAGGLLIQCALSDGQTAPGQICLSYFAVGQTKPFLLGAVSNVAAVTLGCYGNNLGTLICACNDGDFCNQQKLGKIVTFSERIGVFCGQFYGDSCGFFNPDFQVQGLQTRWFTSKAYETSLPLTMSYASPGGPKQAFLRVVGPDQLNQCYGISYADDTRTSRSDYWCRCNGQDNCNTAASPTFFQLRSREMNQPQTFRVTCVQSTCPFYGNCSTDGSDGMDPILCRGDACFYSITTSSSKAPNGGDVSISQWITRGCIFKNSVGDTVELQRKFTSSLTMNSPANSITSHFCPLSFSNVNLSVMIDCQTDGDQNENLPTATTDASPNVEIETVTPLDNNLVQGTKTTEEKPEVLIGSVFGGGGGGGEEGTDKKGNGHRTSNLTIIILTPYIISLFYSFY